LCVPAVFVATSAGDCLENRSMAFSSVCCRSVASHVATATHPASLMLSVYPSYFVYSGYTGAQQCSIPHLSPVRWQLQLTVRPFVWARPLKKACALSVADDLHSNASGARNSFTVLHTSCKPQQCCNCSSNADHNVLPALL
jgi:hypothetical protein